MLYTDFIQKFKISKDKEALAKKHIKRTYVPYAEKLAESKKIADISTHATITTPSGTEVVYKKDTPILFFLKTTRLLNLYTDIEQGETSDINKFYDSLAEIGAFDILLSQIPESEVTQFSAMIDMCVSDIYENERDLSSFLDTKFEAISMVLSTMLESIKETVKDTNIEQLIQNNISKFPDSENITPVTED